MERSTLNSQIRFSGMRETRFSSHILGSAGRPSWLAVGMVLMLGCQPVASSSTDAGDATTTTTTTTVAENDSGSTTTTSTTNLGQRPLPPNGCRDSVDCYLRPDASAVTCQTSASSNCGTCKVGTCDNDAAGCTGGKICSFFDPCVCNGGSCVDDCVTAGCPTGSTCNKDIHLCFPDVKTCQAATGCAADQQCFDAGTGSAICAPAACKVDLDCKAGFCINGACSATAGTCVPAAL